MSIVTRAQWGARAPSRGSAPVPTPVRLAVLHHSAFEGRGGATVRRIQRDQMGRGYRDIAYEVLADDIAIYEGRDWRGYSGATKGQNGVSKAVCLLGNLDVRPITPGEVEQAARGVVWLWRQGAVDAPQFDGGHRDWVSTACPGRHAYAAIPIINRRAAALANPESVMAKPDLVVLFDPTEGVPDALNTVAAPANRPDKKIAAICHAGLAAEFRRDKVRVVAVGKAQDMLANDEDLAGADRVDTGRQLLELVAAL